MRYFVSTLLLISLLSAAMAQPNEKVKNSKEWTWFGIDYVNCYFISKMDFPDPADLKSKLQAWNSLVLLERDKYIDKNLKGRKISYHIDMINERNEQVEIKSRLTNDGFLSSALEPDMIQGIVSSYDIPEDLSGIGLVLIAESYSKPNIQGAYYVTFFDIQTKKVLATHRMLGKSAGFGLRNYWAKSYYEVLKDLGKEYK